MLCVPKKQGLGWPSCNRGQFGTKQREKSGSETFDWTSFLLSVKKLIELCVLEA